MAQFEWIVGAFRKQRVLLLLLTVAAAIRIWTMPYPHEIRDMDEIGYISGGLVVWEGISPGWRVVPAGPQTWIGWCWAAARSARDFLGQPQSTPKLLKPFAAIDQALFDTYADLGPLRQLILWISLGVALFGVVLGFRLGFKYGGEAGGLLIGGLAAVLPMYVEYAGISKSCSDSWMFGIASISCAATLSTPRASWVAGALLGLAIASRLDMLMLAPVLIWALWDNLGTKGIFLAAARMALASILTVIIMAPWLLLAFVGTLRTIAMARVLGYWDVESPRLTTLQTLTWTQGLGPILLVALIGFFLIPAATRLNKWTLLGVTALMVSTMFVGHYQMFRYHGAPLIGILTTVAVGTGALLNRMAKLPAIGTAICLLILPLVQSVCLAIHQRSLSCKDYSTEWIEKHVPPGITVYFYNDFACRTVLPTAQAADAIWKQVANDQAWRTKLEDGFQRFSLTADRFPRALSEDNLCMDRAKSRRWFILGGGSSTRPRYDVRPLAICKTFGLKESQFAAAFKQTGGVFICRTAEPGMLPPDLGEPFIKWVNSHGNGTLLFISDDVRAKLLNHQLSDSQ